MAVLSISDMLAKSDWQLPDSLKGYHTIHLFVCCFKVCLPQMSKTYRIQVTPWLSFHSPDIDHEYLKQIEWLIGGMLA